jgi:hypothetical protein
MIRHFLVAVVSSSLSVIGATKFALAETVGRFECTVVGAASQEPIGDKGHLLRSLQYSCLGMEGLLKGALYTGSTTSEWHGSQGTYLSGGGTIRGAGGIVVTQLTEGTGSVIIKEGKPAGTEASGKGLFKFASGTLAALSGKANRWEAKPAGFGRFTLEVATDSEPGTLRTSQQ